MDGKGIPAMIDRFDPGDLEVAIGNKCTTLEHQVIHLKGVTLPFLKRHIATSINPILRSARPATVAYFQGQSFL